jgi:hypothetical protein
MDVKLANQNEILSDQTLLLSSLEIKLKTGRDRDL